MDYKKIIAESWEFTQSNKKLIRWLGFFPALFTTTFGVGYMTYQFFAFRSSYIFSDGEDHFLFDVLGTIWDFVTSHVSLTMPLVIVTVILAIIYLLFPTLAKAAAIQVISRKRNGQDASVGTGIRYGIMTYLPLLEYHLLIKTFTVFSILTEMSFVVRNLGPVIFKLLLPVFILAFIVGVILTLLFTYADFYIVIDQKGVIESMKASAKLVITNWMHTFLITLLMIIIGVRVIIQAFLVFLIPILIIVVSGYIATVTLPVTSIVIGGVAGAVALVVASYITGVVDVFAYAVWTFTFLEFTSQKEVSARDQVQKA